MAESEAVTKARHALGEQLAAARAAAGHSQHGLAPLTGYSRSTLANVETGRQHVRRDFWERCDAALGTAGTLAAGFDRLEGLIRAQKDGEARRARAEREDRVRRHRPTPQARALPAREGLGPETHPAGLGVSDTGSRALEQLRAELFRGATAHPGRLPGGYPEPAAAPEDVGGLLAALGGSRLPPAEGEPRGPVPGVRAFEGMTLGQSADLLLELFGRLDDELGGDSLYPPLSRYVARMAATAARDPGDGLPAFARLSQMAGWFALDADRHGSARHHLTAAVYAAHEIGDPGLAASALAYLSLQETYLGRPGPALSLARTALDCAADPTPLTRVMLGARLARAQAGLGDRDGCLRTLDRVHTDFARAGDRDEPSWLSYVDLVEVTAQTGACHLDLGMTDDAAATLAEAVTLLEQRAPYRVRDRVHYLARLATCQLAAGGVDQACQTAAEAAELGEAVGSSRIAGRLAAFADRLAPFATVPAARAFRERFRPGG